MQRQLVGLCQLLLRMYAIELLQLYAKAHAITENDPEAPDEDYALFAEEVMKIARDISKE